MQRYANASGSSGVHAYETGTDFIDVQFQDGAVYRYTYNSTGSSYIEEMKRLAAAGKGLSTFISRYVRDNYASKLR